MTDPTAPDSAVPAGAEPIVVPADTTVVDAPAVVTDPADAASSADAPVDSTLTGTPAGIVHGHTNVDEPVVPSTVDDPVGFQTVGDQDSVIDNAALNAHEAEQASTTDQGFITRGGTRDASQGTPAGLDVATPDNVHSDGGPTVFTDSEIDRLEQLNLEAYEEEVQARLDDFENSEHDLEELRGRHSEGADLSGDTSPQINTSGDGSTQA